MKVLVINCGSSTLKFQVIEAASPEAVGTKLAQGTVDRIGASAICHFSAANGESQTGSCQADNHETATDLVLEWLSAAGVVAEGKLSAVGHRVVHGGRHFTQPVRIDETVIAGLEAVTQLAPLHNQPSLLAIRASRRVLGPAMPMVAVFDTAFHSQMPERAAKYAIPGDLAERHHIRRYGFHGIAHRYMAHRCADLARKHLAEMRLITLQLGNGCSACAVANGQSLDTSMGMTPLEGLMMGTRSGDVDPSLAGFISRREGVSVEDVEGWLNRRAGLLGVSGYSQDMRDILAKEQAGDPKAALAAEMFCYRVRKYIGAYLAALGGADAIVFGGGIGENSPEIRARICATMEWCGVELDPQANAATIGIEGLISLTNARMQVYVVPVDEEAVIAQDTLRCLAVAEP